MKTNKPMKKRSEKMVERILTETPLKTVAPRGREETRPISPPMGENVSEGRSYSPPIPNMAKPRVNEGTQLGEYFRRGKVRAIHVAALDPVKDTLRDQDGVVWPIIDRRVRDSGAGPGDWLIVDPDGSVTKCDDRTFKDLFEPAGGWPGEA